MKSAIRFAATFAAVLLLASASSFAQSSDFEVRTTVIDSCVITANDLDFGNYDPNSLVPTVCTPTIDTTCTLLNAYNVGINEGTVGSAVNARQMDDDASSSETLDSTLQCAVGLCAVNWGNTVGTDTFVGVGTGLNIPIVVTGTIAAGQQVTPGAYRDNPVTATITF